MNSYIENNKITVLNEEALVAVSGGFAFLAIAVTPQVATAAVGIFSAGAAAGFTLVNAFLD